MYLLIIYLPRVSLLLPFDIFVCCAFGVNSERRCHSRVSKYMLIEEKKRRKNKRRTKKESNIFGDKDQNMLEFTQE